MLGLQHYISKAMFFDTHCHLLEKIFEADLPAVLRRAALGRVFDLLNLGCDISGSLLSDKMCRNEYQEKMVKELAENGIVRAPKLYGSQGVHPHDSNQTTDEVLGVFLRTIKENPNIVVVGETGLDYFYMHQPREVQLESFRRHMALAQEADLPVSVHTRDAAEDVLMVLQEFAKVRCVMHCFSEDVEFAEKILAMPAGHIISFSGVVTYPKNEELRRVAAMVPDDRIVIETDSPYLAPQPYRGKRNEPIYMVETAKKIAQIRGVECDVFAEQATRNAKIFFGISD